MCLAQRSYEHWRVDIDYRLATYRREHQLIRQLLDSAVHPINKTITVTRPIIFNELIIKDGVVIDYGDAWKMVNSTRIHLNQFRHRVSELNNEVARKLPDTSRYIFKNRNMTVRGTKRFVAPTWIQSIDVRQSIVLNRINTMDINPVIKRVFFESSPIARYDRQKRLYFEGTKVFDRSTFDNILRSGCCNRLYPMSVNKMMTTTHNQTLETPMVVSRAPSRISNLFTTLVHNAYLIDEPLINGVHQLRLTPEIVNPLTKSNLIHTSSMNGITHRLNHDFIFKDDFIINKLISTSGNVLELANHYGPSKLISIEPRHNLMNDNYRSLPNQRISQPVVVIGSSRFMAGLDANQANGVGDFGSFVDRSIVRLDRPANISSRINFGSIISGVTGTNYYHNRPSVTIDNQLNVKNLNGLSIPNDLIFHQLLTSNTPFVVRQQKRFLQWPMFNQIYAQRRVSSLLLPNDVITVLNDDPVSTTNEHSNLLFFNGIKSVAITLSSDNRNFDRLDLDQSVDSAASLVTKSSFVNSLNGVRLLKSQLTVNELFLKGNDNRQGLLNGMRIDDLLTRNESTRLDSPILGRISFIGDVEVSECSFSTINHVTNWINSVVRLNRYPQYVNTRLVFERDPSYAFGMFNTENLIINDHAQPRHSPFFHESQEFMALLRVLSEHFKINGIPVEQRMDSYRIGDRLIMVNQSNSKINGIPLSNILTRNSNGRVSGKVTFVGRVDVRKDLQSNQVSTREAINGIDLVQFDMFRIHLRLVPQQYPNDPKLLKFNNLLLDNSRIRCDIEAKSINSVPLEQFFERILSVSRNQIIYGPKTFLGDVILHQAIQPSLVNGFRLADIKRNAVKIAGHGQWESHFNDIVFHDGLTVLSVIISNQSTVITDGRATSYPELKSMQFKMKHNLIDRIIVKGNLITNSLTVHSSS